MPVRVTPSFALKSLVAVVALTALTLGAAQFMPGTEISESPDIRTTDVVLEDGRTLTVQTREVTLMQWQDCHDAGQCTLDLSQNLREEDYPATGLSYIEIGRAHV